MTDQPCTTSVLRVSELSPHAPLSFDLRPDAEQTKAISDALGLLGLRKLRLSGQIVADGATDWRLAATIGATVTQACVVTLAPVTTRIDDKIARRLLKNWPPEAEEGEEVEMDEDESIDVLGAQIDLTAILTEALSLALPVYPRADDVPPLEAQTAPEGVTPMSDEETRPFAALADLKKKLEGEGN